MTTHRALRGYERSGTPPESVSEGLPMHEMQIDVALAQLFGVAALVVAIAVWRLGSVGSLIASIRELGDRVAQGMAAPQSQRGLSLEKMRLILVCVSIGLVFGLLVTIL